MIYGKSSVLSCKLEAYHFEKGTSRDAPKAHFDLTSEWLGIEVDLFQVKTKVCYQFLWNTFGSHSINKLEIYHKQ